MPHQHDVPKAHSHSHNTSHHHDEHNVPASPLDDADHNAEFGKAVMKPSNAKYNLSQLKFIPLIRLAYVTEAAGLFKIIPQVSPALPDYLIPPDPYLRGMIGLRGPPTFI